MNEIVYNSRNLFYKSPFGAVEEKTEVKFALTLPMEYTYAQPVLIMENGGAEHIVPMEYSETVNDRLIYRCTYTPDSPQTAFYYFKLTREWDKYIVNRRPDGVGVLTDEKCDNKYQLTVYKKGYKTPDSIKGGLYYQIFPDRFNSSGEEHENVPPDRLIRDDWGGTPNFLPNNDGDILNNDYFGGDLKGIEQKLPYLGELGVTVIYINPIFEAHSNHRYNTANYLMIDPLLGTEQDFSNLCAAAKKLGMKVVLDGVFSHTGCDSVYFNKNNRYSTDGAYNSPKSPYYCWFKFSKYPYSYHAWWGFPTLPEVNEEDPSYIDFICGENGVIRHWLKLGASGFRLDVADELPDSFIEHLRRAVKAEGEENLLLGEVWEDASNKEAYGELRRYFLGDELDTVTNYPFKDAILDFVVDGKKEIFFNRVLSIVENYPPQSLHVAMNVLSTHDTERALTRIAGESSEGKDRLWQSHQHLNVKQRKTGLEKLHAAMAIQYFLPGIPSLYYGDEVGMQGYKDPFNRGCFPWGHENKQMLDFCIQLGKCRRECPGLKEGTLVFLESPDGTVVIKREDSEGCTIAAINISDRSQEWKHTLDTGNFRLNGRRIKSDTVEIPPYSYVVLQNNSMGNQ